MNTPMSGDAGDTAGGRAFEHFVGAHSRSLYGTAFLLTGNATAAEELVQDALVGLYPNWWRVEASQAPVAYVRRALVNRFVSGQRRRSAHELALWDMPDSATPGDLAQEVTDRQLLWSMLSRLPERQRAAIVLRYFHDQPDEEIATALGCRPASARSLISRGIAAMRKNSGNSWNLVTNGQENSHE